MLPILIAHRCGPDIYPEQSIASARHAVSLGADFVEMDVQCTSDGVPVICHDPSAVRIFGVDKLVKDMTFAEFMGMRHAADCSYPSHSLENVLRSGVKPILFHCKISGAPLRSLVRGIMEHGFEKQCVIGVLRAEDVGVVKSMCEDIRILAFMPRLEQLDSFLVSRVDIIRLWQGWVTEERVQRIRAAGKELWIMAGDETEKGVGYTSEENMCYWMDLGVDGILVNDIRWARDIVK